MPFSQVFVQQVAKNPWQLVTSILFLVYSGHVYGRQLCLENRLDSLLLNNKLTEKALQESLCLLMAKNDALTAENVTLTKIIDKSSQVPDSSSIVMFAIYMGIATLALAFLLHSRKGGGTGPPPLDNDAVQIFDPTKYLSSFSRPYDPSFGDFPGMTLDSLSYLLLSDPKATLENAEDALTQVVIKNVLLDAQNTQLVERISELSSALLT